MYSDVEYLRRRRRLAIIGSVIGFSIYLICVIIFCVIYFPLIGDSYIGWYWILIIILAIGFGLLSIIAGIIRRYAFYKMLENEAIERNNMQTVIVVATTGHYYPHPPQQQPQPQPQPQSPLAGAGAGAGAGADYKSYSMPTQQTSAGGSNFY